MPELSLQSRPVVDTSTATQVSRLTLTHFRNYEQLTLEAGCAPVVLTGENGAGKTTILEAISLLTPGKGMRGADLRDYARRSDASPHPAYSWGVNADVTANDDSRHIATGQTDPKSARRTVKIEGKAAGQAALAEHCACIWFLPSMVPSFIDSMPVRRKFLDRLTYGFFPQHAAWVSRYEKLMRERNRLLEAPTWDGSWLDALEDGIAEAGVQMATARVQALAALEAFPCPVADFPEAQLELEGTLEEALGIREKALGDSTLSPTLSLKGEGVEHASPLEGVEIKESFRDQLCHNRHKDAAAGRMLVGPHRSRLEICYAATGLPMTQCSTGEQKALLLSLLLAQVQAQTQQRGIAPILLLDEVAANLDPNRRESLFAFLRTLPAQSWLTGTETALFSGLSGDAQCFTVQGGGATPTRL